MSYDDSILSAEKLARELERGAQLCVIDVSAGIPGKPARTHEDYVTAHIPGAIYIAFEDLCAPSKFPHTIPSREQFARVLSEHGVRNNDQIVIYERGALFSAARVWWMFKAFGHERVAILDGGFEGWIALGKPVESGDQSREASQYTAQDARSKYMLFEEMRDSLDDSELVVLDARSSERFRGTGTEPWSVPAGHMPGSINLPFQSLMDGGSLKSKDELEAIFAALPIDAKSVVTSCGSGITAAILYLALYQTGRPDARIYDGSWSEWAVRAPELIVTDT